MHGPLGNPLSLNGKVFGGELDLSWTFSAAMFDEATIQRLADDYVQELTALIGHCCDRANRGVTPSDFPLAALSQAQLGTTVPGLTPSFTSRLFTPGAGGGQLVLSWPFGTLLQATNVAGPWTPSAATSPYTNIISITVPDLFFKLSNP